MSNKDVSEASAYIPSPNSLDISSNQDKGDLKEIITQGVGDELPGKGNKVSVHHTGRLIDDTKFDSSVDREVPFSTLQVSESTLRAIQEMGFEKMTEIQARTIPKLLEGSDIVALAKPGSGKTLAFLIPAIELLHKSPVKGTGVLVISPTRELSMQTFGVAKELLAHHTMTLGLVMGGTSRKAQVKKLTEGVNLLIGTPGRLIHHLKNTPLFLYKNLKCLIIDEADLLFDIGLEAETMKIISMLPENRQLVLFSAAFSESTKQFVKSTECKPLYIGVDENAEKATIEGLNEYFLECPIEKRLVFLFTFLKKNKNKKVMIFFSSCMSAKFHYELLNYMDMPVLCIHGKQTQSKRGQSVAQFRKANGILLCTDIASRGLDIPEVDWVVQYDPPDDPKQYIHRVGRTARGEKKTGKALLILSPDELNYLMYLTQAEVTIEKYRFDLRKLVNVQNKLEKLIVENASLNTSATMAMKSFFGAYKSHHLKKVFNFEKLDLKAVGKSFGFVVPQIVSL